MKPEELAENVLDKITEFCNQTALEAMEAISGDEDVEENTIKVFVANQALVAERVLTEQRENFLQEITEVITEAEEGQE